MPTDLVQSFRIDVADLPNEAILFGDSAAMREVHGQIERILHNDLPVLIRGESGTGKEMIAKFLHARSDRRDSPFVKVNCAAIPASLLESELFGYEGGNADAEPGLVESAAGGTLFLDEIGDLDWELQIKLLDLLEDRQASPAGGSEGKRARARVVCSTNRDLEEAVERRAFRQDLFYRIDVINLNLTPLRERREDIPRLCEHFLEKLAKKFERSAPALTPGALTLLKQWSWPGNLRELENRIARLIVLGDERVLESELNRQVEPARRLNQAPARSGHLSETSRQASPVSRSVLLKALKASHWNRRRAAEALNISYRSLLCRLREVGVPQRRRSHKGPPPKPGSA
jgi:two-component system, NtrC family, response regulator AtoC